MIQLVRFRLDDGAVAASPNCAPEPRRPGAPFRPTGPR